MNGIPGKTRFTNATQTQHPLKAGAFVLSYLDCHRGCKPPLLKPVFARIFMRSKLQPLAQKLNCFYSRGIATKHQVEAANGFSRLY